MLSVKSQTIDTSYFDKLWHPCKKEESKYYRLTQSINGLYKIQDFYNNGILQMDAFAKSIEPEILEGKCTYFYENGNIKSSGLYRKDEPIGVWTYYDKKGKLTNTYDYSLANDYKTSQKEEYQESMSENDNHFSFALRGKLFGFFIIEDNFFSTATIGAEFLLKGRHSLGIDVTYFGWQYERDNTNDEALYETYERRTYAYVDYKYKFLSYKKLDFYINLYDKMGTYHKWQEGVAEGYNNLEKPWLKDKTDGTFNQVAAGLGLKKYYNERFYIDISANGGKLFSNNTSSVYDEVLQTTNTSYNVKSDKNIFYIRINLGYKLFIKRKKAEEVFYTN